MIQSEVIALRERRPRVTAIVVTYFPDLALLVELVQALQPQVDEIVLVDNGSPKNLKAAVEVQAFQNIHLIELGENRGIAAAHNIGIAWARTAGADGVLLMDQDSIAAKNMVDELLRALFVHPKAAALGPRYLDDRQKNPPPFLRVEGFRLKRCACDGADSILAVDYLISSGCLIPMKILDVVGPMRENLFIDYVDIEWGLRAAAKGFQSYGVCAAQMQHALGEMPIKVFGFKAPVHSPLRHYYHFRNAILLYQEPWIRSNWKFVDGTRLLLRFGFYALFARPQMEHLGMMVLGMWDGFRGKNGKK